MSRPAAPVHVALDLEKQKEQQPSRSEVCSDITDTNAGVKTNITADMANYATDAWDLLKTQVQTTNFNISKRYG